jgi:predicted secreted protein
MIKKQQEYNMALNATVYTGSQGVLKYDVLGTPTAIATVKSFTIDQETATVETTSMGASNGARTYLPTLKGFSGSADIYFKDDDEAQSSLFGGIGAAPATLEVYPSGTGKSIKLTGEVIITGFSLKASFDGLVEASISFQGTGELVKTTA